MYKVPMPIPNYCNHCPFGMCHYSYPHRDTPSVDTIDYIDGATNDPNTQGYVCNVDFRKNGKYTKVMRALFNANISKPDWCPLEEVSE